MSADRADGLWLDPGRLYDEFPEGLSPAPPGRPMVAINMVSTADGKAVVGGRVTGIGTRFDRALMDRIRGWFEMVLSGAGTLRADGFNPAVVPAVSARRVQRGLLPQPIAAVVTSTGEIPLDGRFWTQPGLNRLIFTCERGVLEHQDRFGALSSRARVVVVGADDVDLAALARFAQTELGVQRLLVEGGPTLNQGLFSLDLVDELFLTLAPRIVGGHAAAIVESRSEPELDFRKLKLLSYSHRDSELYLRYLVRRG